MVQGGQKVNYHMPLISLGLRDQANWADVGKGKGMTLAEDPLGDSTLSRLLYNPVPPLCFLTLRGGSLQ